MALTELQDIPKKKEEKEPWTFKRLFPLAATVTTLTKVFVNPFDILLGYLVFTLGIAELLNKQVSSQLWVLTIIMLVACFLERRIDTLLKGKPEEKPKK